MRRVLPVVFVACLLVASFPVSGAGQAAGEHTPGPAPEVNSVTYVGDGNVSGAASGSYLWASASHSFSVTVTTTTAIDAELCLVAGGSGGADVTCTTQSFPANATETATVSVSNWPADVQGTQSISVDARAANGSWGSSSDALSLTVITKDGDLDGDGLTNRVEADRGTNLRAADTDGDGLSDKEEVQTFESSPTDADSDDDGLSDKAEIRTHGTDPTVADTDGDGLPDAREVELGTNPTKADTDDDGLPDGAEVNVHKTDPTVPDTDNDGLGDGSEIKEYETNPLASDTDEDGLSDNAEVNTYDTSPTKIDTDGDGLEDGVEVSELETDPTVADTDNDGLDDGKEVHTYGTSPTNPDTDGDGLQDGAEVNRFGTNPNAVDTDGDGISDAQEVDEALVPINPSTAGLIGVTALAILVGGLLFRTGRLSAVPLHRLSQRFPSTWVVGTRNDASDGSRLRSGGSPGDGPRASEAPVPPEFLSSEDRVLQLLDDNEGRMKQSTIVEETGWSKSKVSRVLSEMEADGQVVKVDIGRGNLVTRPDDVPSAAQSSLDG